MPKQVINFKDPLYMTAWLDGALKKEKEKYEKCPIVPDLVPGYENSQAWGYVVTGYFLAEQSFKALLHLRGKQVPKEHSLSTLFELFDENDQSVLREFYTDYKATSGGNRGAFPFEFLDSFLENLDGGPLAGKAGSMAWRYYLTEEASKVPQVSIDYFHEVVFGCNRIIQYARNGRFEPSQYTRSWRMRRERKGKYNAWLTVRMNTVGWDELDDRLEILWGPDYCNRYDLLIFRGTGYNTCFMPIPDDIDLPIVDKRTELEAYDVEEGYRSIGVTFP